MPVAPVVTVAVRSTPCPKTDGLGAAVRVVVLLPVMVSVNIVEVLAASFVSPPYTAFSECAPADSEDVVKLAVPPLRVPMPIWVDPSKNVMVPVAAEGVTVALKVRLRPLADGLVPEPRLRLVTVALMTV